jgi:isocitrate lyase
LNEVKAMTWDAANEIEELKNQWQKNARWQGVRRNYAASAVVNLRPSINIDYSLARHGAERLWKMLGNEHHIKSLGALTGAQAVQMVKGGLQSIYLSGWQVAADANVAGHTFPDQSLYPSNSVPILVKRLNNALMRADQVSSIEGHRQVDWYVPIVADAEAGFGGPLHAFELMKSMIEAGAASTAALTGSTEQEQFGDKETGRENGALCSERKDTRPAPR